MFPLHFSMRHRVPSGFNWALPQAGGRSHIGLTSLNSTTAVRPSERERGYENLTIKRGTQPSKRQENTVLHNNPPGFDTAKVSRMISFWNKVMYRHFGWQNKSRQMRNLLPLPEHTIKTWGSSKTCLSIRFFGRTPRKHTTSQSTGRAPLDRRHTATTLYN